MRGGSGRPRRALQRQLGDLAAHAVEGREHDRLRRVVDDEVHAGEVLERPDVAPLPADDPALHVVGGELDERDGRLGRMARGDPLERVRDEVSRPALRVRCGPPPRAGAPSAPARGGRAPPSARALPLRLVRPSDREIRSSSRELLRPSRPSPPPGAAEVRLAIDERPARAARARRASVDLLLLREDALLDLDDLGTLSCSSCSSSVRSFDGLLARLDLGFAPDRPRPARRLLARRALRSPLLRREPLSRGHARDERTASHARAASPTIRMPMTSALLAPTWLSP